MRKILPGLFACMALALIVNPDAWAHTLYMTVEDNEENCYCSGDVLNGRYRSED